MGKFIMGFVSILILFGTFVGTIVVLGLLLAIPTMFLWDWLMTELFGLKEITLFQAWGLNILSGIFFRAKSMSKDIKKVGKTKINRKINLHD